MRSCLECGIKLKENTNFCSNCGADLQNQKNHSDKKNQRQGKKDSPDHISTNQILMIMGGLIVVVVIMLYAGGVFDTPSTVTTSAANVPAAGNTQNSVDLNAIQKINTLRDRIKANPEDHQAVLELAHALMDSRMFDEAIANYDAYLKTHPGLPDVMIDMAVCYFEKQDYTNADRIMREAVKIDPKHQIGHLNLGIVNLAKGDTETSKEWLKKAVALNPNTDAGKKAQSLLESH
ncbi:MAG: tetratricopeptide repeat protein [Ignavibacteriaceae bacterium]|nr:tetratricopeptide repeat protein [Ignavibacteriaceae bacterium]